jgi:hypothetical protein
MTIPKIGHRPLRFGMRVRVTGKDHFYEGLAGTLIAAACHEPFYQISLDLMPENEAWIDGAFVTPLNKDEPGYEPEEPLPELLIELED